MEDFDGALGEMRKLIERGNNRLTFTNLALAERYTKGDLRIVVLFSGGRRKEDYYAFLQREEDALGGHVNVDDSVRTKAVNSETALHPHRSAVNKPGSETGGNQADGDYCAVLVEDVQSMDLPESYVVPSVVWLERADKLNARIGGALYSFFDDGLKRLLLPSDGKLRLGAITLSEFDDLARQEVESGSEVVYGVANHSSQQCGGWVSMGNDTCMALPFFVVITGLDTIRICCKEIGDDALDVVDVGFGPFDL